MPDGVREHFAEGVGARGRTVRTAWLELFERYHAAHPELAEQLSLMQRRELPQGWDADLPVFPADKKGIATRDSSGNSAQRAREEHSVVDGRSGRSGAIDQDAV